MKKPNDSISFPHGQTMKNRFMLAPMTNSQSHNDGRVSLEEINWLEMRAKGGFGLVMTSAAHVQENGKGFKGQMGIFSDDLIPGHRELTSRIKMHGSLVMIQLHHAGMRSPHDLIEGDPVSASKSEKYGTRALELSEVYQLRDDFIAAAIRSRKAGYDGVEIHGAHGYILTQFLSEKFNKRTDRYGGSLENRSRIIFEIVDGIRANCGKEFLLSVRLSPERFGMKLDEVKVVSQRLIDTNQLDFLDISLWDCFKLPKDELYEQIPLIEHFAALDYNNTLLTAAGKIYGSHDVHKALNAGLDFVTIGHSGILHHNFPELVNKDSHFTPTDIPVSEIYLKKEGLSNAFIDYMRKWPNFVKNYT